MTNEQLEGYRTLPLSMSAFSPTAEVSSKSPSKNQTKPNQYIPIPSEFILKLFIPVIWPVQSSIFPVEAGTIEGGCGNVPKLVNHGHMKLNI